MNLHTILVFTRSRKVRYSWYKSQLISYVLSSHSETFAVDTSAYESKYRRTIVWFLLCQCRYINILRILQAVQMWIDREVLYSSKSNGKNSSHAFLLLQSQNQSLDVKRKHSFYAFTYLISLHGTIIPSISLEMKQIPCCAIL